ncbi:MAG: hypothetical protein GPJ51_07230 [Candidatus Heimdallarchaeota archaeon]|nr:hypothetical protein [Candidatus Heimdallarchaeota archaeon]
MSKNASELGSKFYSKYIQRIFTFIGYMQFSITRMKKIFPYTEELKEELSNFGKTLKKVDLDRKTIPYSEELEEGKVRITMKKSHKKALDFIFEEFSFEKYLEFIYRYAIQFIFTESDNYIISFITFLLKKNPGILGKITFSAKELETKEKKDIIEEMISKSIHNQLYEGYRSTLKTYIQKKIGLKHNIENKLIDELSELKLIRDIYTHGDGKVNQIFLRKTNRQDVKLGMKIEIGLETINQLLEVSQRIIIKLDSVLLEKNPEIIDNDFIMKDFIKAQSELNSLFSREEVEERVKNL